MNIGFLGLGKLGLPVSLAVESKGHNIFGYDISKETIQDKDLQSTKKDFSYIEKIIDLHGYSLEEANIKIEKFILSSFEKGVRKINIITGKGSRSNNLDDPYQSKDLSILKYSVPNYIKNNPNLMSKILKIDFIDRVE